MSKGKNIVASMFFKAGNESLPFLLSELGASSCGKIYMMTERTGIA